MTKTKETLTLTPEEAEMVKKADEFAMEGFEESELSIQTLPIITMAQAQTPEVQEAEIEGLVQGVLMNNTTKMPMGTSIDLVIYKMWEGRTKFPPRDSNGPIECYSPDGVVGRSYGKCRECAFADFELKDKCLQQHFFLVAPVTNPNEVYRLIMAKSNKTIGKKLVATMRSECSKHQAPLYGVKIQLSTKKVKNEKANAYYYIFDPKPLGMVPKEQWEELREVFLQMTDLRKDSITDFYKSLETSDVPEDGEIGDIPEEELGNLTNGDALL